jgi:hypothetical protein
MTDQQRQRITELITELRKRAVLIGSLSPLWDVIFDLDALLSGKETLLRMTVDEHILFAEKCLRPSLEAPRS